MHNVTTSQPFSLAQLLHLQIYPSIIRAEEKMKKVNKQTNKTSSTRTSSKFNSTQQTKDPERSVGDARRKHNPISNIIGIRRYIIINQLQPFQYMMKRNHCTYGPVMTICNVPTTLITSKSVQNVRPMGPVCCQHKSTLSSRTCCLSYLCDAILPWTQILTPLKQKRTKGQGENKTHYIYADKTQMQFLKYFDTVLQLEFEFHWIINIINVCIKGFIDNRGENRIQRPVSKVPTEICLNITQTRIIQMHKLWNEKAALFSHCGRFQNSRKHLATKLSI